MIARPIIDAGPALNFLSVNRERLLFATLGALSTPETVRDEVLRKARSDRRFERSASVLAKLPASLLAILSDDETPALAAAVERIARLPMAERIRRGQDLGELMVIAHAVAAPKPATPQQ